MINSAIPINFVLESDGVSRRAQPTLRAVKVPSLRRETIGVLEMQFVANQIDQIIMFCAGIWLTAMGFGYVTISTQQAWRAKFVRHFRWMGPLLILISIVLALAK
jgi:hypothetical protein